MGPYCHTCCRLWIWASIILHSRCLPEFVLYLSSPSPCMSVVFWLYARTNLLIFVNQPEKRFSFCSILISVKRSEAERWLFYCNAVNVSYIDCGCGWNVFAGVYTYSQTNQRVQFSTKSLHSVEYILTLIRISRHSIRN